MSVGGAGRLLERERELERLREQLSAACRGAGAVAIVEGEAGVGKTSVLQAASDSARELGCEVLTARGGVFERAFGFGVVRQLLEARLRRAGAAQRRSLLSGSASLAGPALGLDVRPGAPEEFAAHHGLYWLVANLAEQAPLALMVDDAHWCDLGSLRWLLYLARRMDALPLVLLMAVRIGEQEPPADELMQAIAVEPVATAVRLAPLSAAATGELLQLVYERPVADEFAAACHGWTAGNPFLVKELARDLLAMGVEPSAAAVARMSELSPEAVRRSVLLRLSQLGADAIALARSLAVLGSPSRLRHVAALADLDPAAAARAADLLIARRILEPGGGRLRFAHPLIAAVVYDDVPTSRRGADHARAARLLAQDGAAPDQVSLQLLRSEPAGDGWVVAQLRAAAAEVLRGGTADAAATLLERAISEPPSEAELAATLRELAAALDLSGDSRRAASFAREALGCADAPEFRGATAIELGRVLTHDGQFSEACGVLIDALESAPPGDLHRLLEIHLCLLLQFAPGEGWREAHERLERLAPSLSGDTPEGRAALAALAIRRGHLAEPAERTVAPAREVLERGAGRDAGGETVVVGSALSAMIYCDALDEAQQWLTRWLEHWQAAGSSFGIAQAWYLQGRVHRTRGELVEAIGHAEQAVRAMGPSGEDWTRALCVALIVDAMTERGQLEQAGALLERDGLMGELPAAPMFGVLLEQRGRWRAATGDYERALADLLASADRHAAWGSVSPAFSSRRSALALVLWQRGDSDEAASVAGEDLKLARQVGLPRLIGVALVTAGLIAGGEGGIELLEEAVAALQRSAARLEHARALIELGAALRRAGCRRDARAPLSEGLAIAQRCAAGPVAERARTELRAAGGRPRAPHQDRRRRPDPVGGSRVQARARWLAQPGDCAGSVRNPRDS